MPVISFISPKGGVGKTTAATLLATQLARKAKVVVIDADPNRPIAAWAKLAGKPDNLEIVTDANQENIIDKIDAASREAPFVVVDCEGTASLTVAYAIGASDLVIVPTQGSQLDAKQAGRALVLIKNQEKQARRRIAHAVLLTRTSPALKPRTLGHIQDQLQEHGVLVLNAQLNEREAFRAMFSFGGTLETLTPDQAGNVERAIGNARAFAAEVVDLLKRAGEGDSPASERAVA
ncbi:MAG: ParA family protein [Saprospiraceae bacterium]